MKIEKLPSGSYRLRKMKNYKTYTLIVDHKPGKAEAEDLINDYIRTYSQDPESDSFASYARKYISAKENVLSPCTIRLYNGTLNALSSSFKDIPLVKITGEDIQREVNQYSIGHAPKTVRNMHGFISAIMEMYRPSFSYRTTLPQKVEYDYYIPTSQEVKLVLDAAKGSEYEIVFRLGTYGLRRSECIAITPDQLDGNSIRIDRAIVINNDGKFVEKTTKTTKSTREIFIDDSLAEMIREKGYAYKGHPNNIVKALHHYQDKVGVPHFRFHDLRHYFATEMAKLISSGVITEKDAEYLGGWSSDYTMKRIYQHSRADRDENIRKTAAAHLYSLLSDQSDSDK